MQADPSTATRSPSIAPDCLQALARLHAHGLGPLVGALLCALDDLEDVGAMSGLMHRWLDELEPLEEACPSE